MSGNSIEKSEPYGVINYLFAINSEMLRGKPQEGEDLSHVARVCSIGTRIAKEIIACCEGQFTETYEHDSSTTKPSGIFYCPDALTGRILLMDGPADKLEEKSEQLPRIQELIKSGRMDHVCLLKSLTWEEFAQQMATSQAMFELAEQTPVQPEEVKILEEARRKWLIGYNTVRTSLGAETEPY